MKSTETIFCEKLLQKNAYRLTPGRIALLTFLKQSKKPLSVQEIYEKIHYPMNKVTLYRALEDFSKSKIITKINLRESAAYYEFLHTDHHHHHIICELCGTLEDIEHCHQVRLQGDALLHSKSFTRINSHSLEFFGICRVCSSRV